MSDDRCSDRCLFDDRLCLQRKSHQGPHRGALGTEVWRDGQDHSVHDCPAEGYRCGQHGVEGKEARAAGIDPEGVKAWLDPAKPVQERVRAFDAEMIDLAMARASKPLVGDYRITPDKVEVFDGKGWLEIKQSIFTAAEVDDLVAKAYADGLDAGKAWRATERYSLSKVCQIPACGCSGDAHA